MANKLSFNNLEIKDFRSIRHLKSTEFSKINLVAGKNNSGKTSLLEALFIAAGPTNPELWLRANIIRGMTSFGPASNSFKYLFHNLDPEKHIHFSLSTRSIPKYKVELNMEEDIFTLDTSDPPKHQEEGSELQPLRSIRVTYTTPNSEPIISEVVAKHDGIQFRGKTETFKNSVFVSARSGISDETEAKRYSSILKGSGVSQIENALMLIEPGLTRTSLAIDDDRTLIHADAGYGLVPLNLLGSGTTKFMTLLLSMADSRDAVIMVDEIENGIHYSMLPKLWEAIIQFAKYYDCQVIATTHSLECIRAANSSMRENSFKEFRLHRIDRLSEGHKMVSFESDQIEAALESGWELR